MVRMSGIVKLVVLRLWGPVVPFLKKSHEMQLTLLV